MKIALRITALSLLVALATTASARLTIPAATPCQASATVSDPDPADCPFCGGNPALHVRLLVGLERTSMALLTVLAR
ncbi:MAG: hypothetical protein JNL28_01690 [Planctomycetes bacterium]|nr:hypothetical protein [Planctomycetota bacterium]